MEQVKLVYESKFGNTKLIAEAIAEGIREASGKQIIINELKEIDLRQPVDFEMILIGSPNHMGGPTNGIKKFIDKLSKLNVEGKYAAVFDTYMAKDYEKAVKKMEKQINQKLPQLKLLSPGLSIRVEGMKGPVTEGELPRCKEFGIKIAANL